MSRIPLPKRNEDGSYTPPLAGMMIDGDGAPNVYGPKGTSPLDDIKNAGSSGCWFGVVTDNGKSNGRPVVQGKNDPYPGYFVSSTSYERKGFSRSDPRRYLDSTKVIYVVLPSHWRAEAKGVVLGCKVKITDKKTSKSVYGVIGDFGPKAKLGEASIACAKFFGIPSSPKNGGTDEKRFIYQFYPDVPADGFELQPV